MALLLPPAAPPDVLYLTNGGTVEGDIVSTEGRQYVVRTVVGPVTLPAEIVQRVEESPSPFEEYDRRAQAAGESAAAQFELAEWCDDAGLGMQRRKHLQRALELDPDFAPARSALGYVRVGALWIDGRSLAENGAKPPAQPPENAADRDDDRVVAAVQGTWHRRIAAIKRSHLESTLDRLTREGRERILEIRDPLAVLPLVEVLSRGSLFCRQVLVEALSHFDTDEATLNLAVLALLDPDGGVRDTVLRELVRRDDPRVIPQFREALKTKDNTIIGRAAEALGRLEAREAVPDLIPLLRGKAIRRVELSAEEYFGSFQRVFSKPVVWDIGSYQVAHQPRIGFWRRDGLTFLFDPVFLPRRVTVFRTAVLDALVQITGQNFGFDDAAWQRWYQEFKP